MRTLFTSLFCAFSFTLSLACSFHVYDFCASSDTFPDRNILAGYITHLDSNGINLEILHSLRGDETRTNIRIWDRSDWDCNGWFGMSAEYYVEEGDTIIMILPKITVVEETWDIIGDYAWPNLHFYQSLYEIHDDKLFVGDYNFQYTPSYPLDFEYSFFISSWFDNHLCNRIVDTEEIKPTKGYSIFPNPARQEIQISGLSTEKETLFSIYDLSGKKVSIKNSTSNGNRIPVTHLQQGVYFIRLEEEKQILKFVKL